MRSSTKIILASGGSIFLLLILFLLFTSPEPEPEVTDSTPQRKPSSSSSLPSSEGYDWAVDQEIKNEVVAHDSGTTTCQGGLTGFDWTNDARQMYQWQSTQVIAIDPIPLLGDLADLANGGQKSSQVSSLDLKGTLNFRIFEELDGNIIVGFQMSPVEVTTFKQRVPELEELFQSFFLATFSPTGEVLEFHFPRTMALRDRMSLQSVVSQIQMVFPRAGDVSNFWHWNVNETDSSGNYESYYTVVGNDCDELHKEKLRYLSIIPLLPPQDGVEAEFIGTPRDSSFQATFKKGNSWINSFSGSETLEVTVDGDMVTRSESYITVDLSTFDPDLELQIWTETRGFAEILAEFNRIPESERNATTAQNPPPRQKNSAWLKLGQSQLKEKMKGQSVPKLVNRMEEMILGKQTGNRVASIHQLRDYFIAFPESTLDIPDYFKEEEPHYKLVANIILALELSDTDEAQVAMSDIFGDVEQTRLARLQATSAATGFSHVSALAIGRLWDNANIEPRSIPDIEFRNSALLALGGIAGELTRKGRVGEGEGIKAELIDRLQSSQQITYQAVGIRALGNTKDDAMFNPIGPYLDSPSATVRESALHASRYFNSEESLQSTVAMLTDSFFAVREKAVRVLGERPLGPAIEALSQRLSLEPNSTVRIAIVVVLGKNKHNHPQATEALKQQLEVESVGQVKKEILKALYE